ncbi:MAG: YebC/PmpR family DNA-binding transcriptional regulator, partial [Gammaproteobacteria bacterium]|nr:YebC/PmpR family DNA-binding transcriptional regulator [Gammaproteobacteria bacterium]
ITYEGYGPGGVAILVKSMTDNRNRTVAEVRHIFTRSGGNLGTSGSVSYLFRDVGVITFAPGGEEDKIMEIALNHNAEDVVVNEDGSIEVITTAEDFASTKQALEEAELTIADAELTLLSSVTVPLDVETAEKLMRMVDAFEDLDDVQSVHHNAELSDAIMEQLQPIK